MDMPAEKKHSVFMHLKGIIAVTLIGSAIALLMTPFDHLNWKSFSINLLYSLLIGSSLWFGNFSIDPILGRIFKKNPLKPGKKLVYSLLSMTLVSLGMIFLVNWFWVEVIWGGSFEVFISRSGKTIMIIEFIVVIVIALVLYTNEFFHSWREAVKNEEALKRDKLALEYEALKNQVNPHFLFNSLNTLSGLIPRDTGKATRFVKQLSDIYRYVLEHKDRELVPLETEMGFVENYISLMKIRFGDNLKYHAELPPEGKYRLIPLSVQMLVENAIKHNIVSAEKPLHITIGMEENRLKVVNNLQKKSSIMKGEGGEWEKHGLVNISSRYAYLSGGGFEVNGSSEAPFPESLNGEFVVHIPLIKA